MGIRFKRCQNIAQGPAMSECVASGKCVQWWGWPAYAQKRDVLYGVGWQGLEPSGVPSIAAVYVLYVVCPPLWFSPFLVLFWRLEHFCVPGHVFLFQFTAAASFRACAKPRVKLRLSSRMHSLAAVQAPDGWSPQCRRKQGTAEASLQRGI